MSVDRLDLGLRFHHFGLAVPTPVEAFRFLAALGYSDGAATYDPLQNVNVALRHHAAMPDVEVVWPGDGRSPIDQLVRRGHMVYHLCYICNEPQASLRAMAALGLDVLEVTPPTPAQLFGGVPVSFHTVDRFGLIELIHGEPRPMVVC
jgi:hypothetical protein